MNFFEQFDSEWASRLGLRKSGFRSAFEYLAKNRPRGHLIIETGCARRAENWEIDGLSTFLFDRFAEAHDGEVMSVDLNPKACECASSLVGPRTKVFNEDSIPFLHRLGRELVQANRPIDLLYLDSFDFSLDNPAPSAVHHLKELCAIAPALSPKALVMVDDSFRRIGALRTGLDSFAVLHDQGIGGKGMYVAQYFEQLGVPILFEGYQCGWVIPD
jgi:hypothetical protein